MIFVSLLYTILSCYQTPGTVPKNGVVDMKHLQNIWWNKDVSEHAVFRIDKNTMFYVDTESDQATIPYKVKGDSLLIYYGKEPMGFNIERLNKDTMILSDANGTYIYTTKPTQ